MRPQPKKHNKCRIYPIIKGLDLLKCLQNRLQNDTLNIPEKVNNKILCKSKCKNLLSTRIKICVFKMSLLIN